MPQSISEATYITVNDTCKILPGRPHRNTVIRWFDRGFKGIRLESWRCGNRRVTTVQAIDKFLAETSGFQNPNPPSTSPGHRYAESKLDAMGIK